MVDIDMLPGKGMTVQRAGIPMRNMINATAIVHNNRDSKDDLVNYNKQESEMNQKDYLYAVTGKVRRPYNFVSTDRYLNEELYHEEEGGAYLSGDEEDHLSPLKPRGDGNVDSALRQDLHPTPRRGLNRSTAREEIMSSKESCNKKREEGAAVKLNVKL